ncbi:MAG: hypothetical protein ACYS76_13940 [Planctomycetota bacterium]
MTTTIITPMLRGKKEIQRVDSKNGQDRKARKKKRLKRLLLLHTPARYHPLQVPDSKQVSPYLTHELAPQFYNGAQRGEPFEAVVSQKGINEIIAYSRWPKESGGASFSAPAVLFVPENIVLMGTVTVQGVEFVVTIVLEASLSEAGLLNLRAAKVKVGAMNITPVARMIARRMYRERTEAMPIDKTHWRAKVVASLLNDEAFEPVFSIRDILGGDDQNVRITKVTIKDKELILGLVPAPDETSAP